MKLRDLSDKQINQLKKAAVASLKRRKRLWDEQGIKELTTVQTYNCAFSDGITAALEMFDDSAFNLIKNP